MRMETQFNETVHLMSVFCSIFILVIDSVPFAQHLLIVALCLRNGRYISKLGYGLCGRQFSENRQIIPF